MVLMVLRGMLWNEEMLAFLFPGLSKGSSSFKTFPASKHDCSEALGDVIPAATAVLPVNEDPSPGFYLVLIASQRHKKKYLFPVFSSRRDQLSWALWVRWWFKRESSLCRSPGTFLALCPL